MALALGQGMVAVADGSRVVGTVLTTAYGPDAASISMVIVDPDWRGCGVGRRLMDAAIDLAGDRPLRLTATREGLPLYEKLGFRETGRIVQHQGECRMIAAPPVTDAVAMAEPADLPAIAVLDRLAFGADRGSLIARIAAAGRFTVLRAGGAVAGFAGLRAFGRGQVIGPVVAADAESARILIGHVMSGTPGAFVRVDTDAETGLGPWLAERGLVHVGGGVSMRRPAAPTPDAPAPDAPVSTFALASQALG